MLIIIVASVATNVHKTGFTIHFLKENYFELLFNTAY